MTWRVGPGDELTWHAGPPRGCDAALRPHGRAASGPREAQVGHRARTRGEMAGDGCSQDDGDCVDPSPRDHQIAPIFITTFITRGYITIEGTIITRS